MTEQPSLRVLNPHLHLLQTLKTRRQNASCAWTYASTFDQRSAGRSWSVQASARAGVAPQHDVGRPPVAPRGDGGACYAGLHVTAQMVLVWRRVCRRAARCTREVAGSGGAELGRCLVPFGAAFCLR